MYQKNPSRQNEEIIIAGWGRPLLFDELKYLLVFTIEYLQE